MTRPTSGGEQLDAIVQGYDLPATPDLDTRGEQAAALVRDLHDSFAPTYLTLISIIEGVLLGFMFELLSEGRPELHAGDPATLLVVNNVILIVLVWNEYRMGASMYHWIPSLLDAVIPVSLGGVQAALILTVGQPRTWVTWLMAFYLTAAVAYENMYQRSAHEARNALVIENNRFFRLLNPLGCAAGGAVLAALVLAYKAYGTTPGWVVLGALTAANLAFLIRGEVNWRRIVAAARWATTQPVAEPPTLAPPA